MIPRSGDRKGKLSTGNLQRKYIAKDIRKGKGGQRANGEFGSEGDWY